MKNKLLLIFSFIILSISTQANVGFKVGVNTGLTVAKIKDKYYSDRNSNLVGFQVGIPMEIKISKYFAIQPEINFVQKGFSLKNYGIAGIDKEFRRRTYLDIPILFKLIYPMSEKHSANLYLGFSVGYALNNQQILKLSDGTKVKNKLPFDNNVNDDNIAYRRYDLCIPFGFGYEYKINQQLAFFTDLRWLFDVNNNIQYKIKPDPTPSYKYRNFIFSVGLSFIAKNKS